MAPFCLCEAPVAPVQGEEAGFGQYWVIWHQQHQQKREENQQAELLLISFLTWLSLDIEILLKASNFVRSQVKFFANQ